MHQPVEQQQVETVELRIGFTLLDICCGLTYIGLAGAMGYLYGIEAGLMVVAAGAVVGYAAVGVTSRMMARVGMARLEAVAVMATEVMNLATAEIKELKRQLDVKHGS